MIPLPYSINIVVEASREIETGPVFRAVIKSLTTKLVHYVYEKTEYPVYSLAVVLKHEELSPLIYE